MNPDPDKYINFAKDYVVDEKCPLFKHFTAYDRFEFENDDIAPCSYCKKTFVKKGMKRCRLSHNDSFHSSFWGKHMNKSCNDCVAKLTGSNIINEDGDINERNKYCKQCNWYFAGMWNYLNEQDGNPIDLSIPE